jgi:hypothetical protein
MKGVPETALFVIVIVIIAGVVLLYNSAGFATLWRF